MRKAPVTISRSGTMAEAAQHMQEAAVGAVLVLDGDHLVGIVTDRDIALRGVGRHLPPGARIDTVMTPEPVTVCADEELTQALNLFYRHPIRRLPVLDGGQVVGMLTVDEMILRMANDLDSLVRPVFGQVVFGLPEREELPLVEVSADLRRVRHDDHGATRLV
jgi:signal-transduction protein with cAMP-binding, CBS, and nucleotidyltransferase domain